MASLHSAYLTGYVDLANHISPPLQGLYATKIFLKKGYCGSIVVLGWFLLYVGLSFLGFFFLPNISSHLLEYTSFEGLLLPSHLGGALLISICVPCVDLG